ncbi:MAG: MFS transporter [Alphaproteobacteria bacterium]
MEITVNDHLPASFNRLAWSNLAAQSAEQVGLAAAPIVAVLAFGAGPGETGWLQTLQTLPFLLLAIPAGVLADRMSRRRLMVSAEWLRTLSLSAILVLALCGWLNLPLLAGLGFLGACGTIAYTVAAPALVPALVPAALLGRANARIELARTVAFAGGPALAGGIVGWIGGGPAFGIAAALSLTAVVLLTGIAEPPRVTDTVRNPLAELKEGLAFVARHPMLNPVFTTQFVFGTAWFMILAVFVPYAVDHLGLGAASVGVVIGCYGAGMVVGALLAGTAMRRLRFGLVVGLGPVCGLFAALTIAATIWLPSAPLAGVGFFVMGAGPIIWVISTTTLRQAVTPARLLGRASAINVLAYGARPLGAALGAVLGGWFGAEICLLVAVAGFAAQAAIILVSPVVRLASQPALGGRVGERAGAD